MKNRQLSRSSFFLNPIYGVALFIAALLTNVRAEITVTNHYRMGEGETGAVGNSAGPFTDILRPNNPGLTDLPNTTNSIVWSNVVSPRATGNVGSVRSVFFSGVSTMGGPVISTAVDNFGLEAWILPTVFTGNAMIAYNGDPSQNGWGIERRGNVIKGLLGGRTNFGSFVLQNNTWTHVAIVRSAGTTTLYVDGVASGSTVTTPRVPAGEFVVGTGYPRLTDDMDYLGYMDELRFFTFAAGRFSPTDFLYFAPNITLKGNFTVDIPNGATTPNTADKTDFGTAAVVGRTVVRTFVVENDGQLDLTLPANAITVTGRNASDFSVGGISLPATVVPGDRKSFTLTYDPSAYGLRTAMVNIVSNDLDEVPFKFAIQGMTHVPKISIEQPVGTPLVAPTIVGWGASDSGGTLAPSELTTAKAIAAGVDFSVALKSDGTVTAWGGQITVPAGLVGVAAISAGADFVVALKDDGTVMAWGGNDSGQTNVPNGLTEVKAIAAGFKHAIALKTDGSLVAWGSTADGATLIPNGLTGVVAISAGEKHTLALKNDGTVVAWGGNALSQTNIPAGLVGVTAIAAGMNYSSALKNDGTVVAWGESGDSPAAVANSLTGVEALSAGGKFFLALRNDRTVAGWGSNSQGQLNVPTGLTDVYAIAGGGYHSLALQMANVDFGFQDLPSGSLTKTFTIKNTGVEPLALSSVTVIGENAANFTVNTGGMLNTLRPANGQTTFTVTFSPSSIGGKSTILRVVSDDPNEPQFEVSLTGTGREPEIAVSGNATDIPDGDTTPTTTKHTDFGSTNVTGGTVTRTYTLANGGNGNLTIGAGAITLTGVNATDFSVGGITLPVTIPPGTTVTFTLTFDPSNFGLRRATVNLTSNDLDEGIFDFAVQGSGPEADISVERQGGTLDLRAVTAWGDNTYGQTNVPPDLMEVQAIAAGVGDNLALKRDGTVIAWGYSASRYGPVPSGLTGVKAIAVSSHAVALKTDGTVVAWGNSGAGQTDVPIGLTGVKAIAAGQGTTVALKSDGTLAIWGFAATEELQAPAGLTGVEAISAGNFNIAALKNDGTVVAWGDNRQGQSTVPAGLTGVQAIACGRLHTVALKRDGTVVAWGENRSGETDVPVGLTRVKAIAAGFRFTVALKDDGTVVAWGDNSYGQTSSVNAATNVLAIAAGDSHAAVLRGVDFGATTPRSTTGSYSTNRELTIRNTGASSLWISEISTRGGDASDFSFTNFEEPVSFTPPSIEAPFIIAPNATVNFTVHFTPGAPGPRSTHLRIFSNDPDKSPYSILVSGMGTLPISGWRLTHFGSADDSGNGANDFDFDKDGVTNFMEYAFGLNPTIPDASGIPQPIFSRGSIRYQFVKPAYATGIRSYWAETSTTLENSSWTLVLNADNSPRYQFTIPTSDSPRKFVRLRVRSW